MELKRIDVARQLWQMLRGILRDGGYVQSGSKMRNTANSFEDELYNPPKSEQGDSKNSSQAVQHLKAEIAAVAYSIVFDLSGGCVSNMQSIQNKLRQLSAVE